MGAAPFDRSLVPAGILAADLDALAAEFGTPLFVYDEDHLRARCREFADAFGADHVAFAGKSFLCSAMVRLVADEGLHLDTASGGELHVALHAGMPAARITLHGNNKSDAELRRALTEGVGRIVADSDDELDRLERLAAEIGVRPRVLVRVTPGVHAHTHEYIETGTEESKFGFTVSNGVALAAAARVVASDLLEFGGLHCHIGSQIWVLESFTRAVDVVLDLVAQVRTTTGATVADLVLGGGFGARYLSEDPEIGVAEYARTLLDAVAAGSAARDLPVPAVHVEPGRSIVAAAAVTLYRVGTVKEIPGVGTYVAIDGGMSDNPRPVLYGAGYEAYLPDRIDEPRPLGARIAGKHCEQGDVIVTDAHLPAGVTPGDLLVTPVTGAYGYSMASNYNKIPRPAVVFLRGGAARLVIRRETEDDLTRLDVD
ncbi:MAG: diaminopimelate decarboxylase [Actinomycetes bacterium]